MVSLAESAERLDAGDFRFALAACAGVLIPMMRQRLGEITGAGE